MNDQQYANLGRRDRDDRDGSKKGQKKKKKKAKKKNTEKKKKILLLRLLLLEMVSKLVASRASLVDRQFPS
jgi:hypothetical protein